LQRTHRPQGGIIEQGVAAALFDPGGTDLAGFVDDEQDLYFAFQATCDGFGRVKLTGLIEFFKMLADGLGPRLYLLWSCAVAWLWWDFGGLAAASLPGLGCSGRLSGGVAAGAGGGRNWAVIGAGASGFWSRSSPGNSGNKCSNSESASAAKSR
jgi:hypothetical protein